MLSICHQDGTLTNEEVHCYYTLILVLKTLSTRCIYLFSEEYGLLSLPTLKAIQEFTAYLTLQQAVPAKQQSRQPSVVECSRHPVAVDRALAEDSHKVEVVHMAEGIRVVGVERIPAVVHLVVYSPDLVQVLLQKLLLQSVDYYTQPVRAVYQEISTVVR